MTLLFQEKVSIMYDSTVGRFISRDPVGGDPNPYRYAGNNPGNAMDPSGLQHVPLSSPGISLIPSGPGVLWPFFVPINQRPRFMPNVPSTGPRLEPFLYVPLPILPGYANLPVIQLPILVLPPLEQMPLASQTTDLGFGITYKPTTPETLLATIAKNWGQAAQGKTLTEAAKTLPVTLISSVKQAFDLKISPPEAGRDFLTLVPLSPQELIMFGGASGVVGILASVQQQADYLDRAALKLATQVLKPSVKYSFDPLSLSSLTGYELEMSGSGKLFYTGQGWNAKDFGAEIDLDFRWVSTTTPTMPGAGGTGGPRSSFNPLRLQIRYNEVKGRGLTVGLSFQVGAQRPQQPTPGVMGRVR
jgi:hypothetical protein